MSTALLIVVGIILSITWVDVMSVSNASPTKGQKVPVGGLTISGISEDNPTSDCHTNINHVRPYQNTSTAPPNGATDY